MQYPFGGLSPDAGATAAGKVMTAQGVLPKADGYGPFPQLVTVGSTALPASPRGDQTCIKRDGTTVVFRFTATKVYQMETDYTFTEIDTGRNCSSGDDWSTMQFGDYLLYTNTTDGLLAYNIESGGSPTYIADAGDPREIFGCANMVFALDVKDDTGTRDNRGIRNCAEGDHTNWSTREADFDSMEYGGEFICGRNLSQNTAALFQRQGIKLLRFAPSGAGSFYTLSDVSNEIGAVGAKSTVVGDGVIYSLSTKGFIRLGANGLERIGAGKVDQWFLARVALADLPKVQGAIDPARNVVIWRYPMSSDASSTVTENAIGFSWEFEERQWFTLSVQLAYLSRIATPGYTLTSWAAAFATLAASPDIPIGDRFWQGGKQQVLAALDSSLKHATFSGTPMAALIETAVGNSPVTGLINFATPIDDAANSQLSLGVSQALSNTMTWKTAASKATSGRVPLRGRGMNLAFRYSVAAGEAWTYAKGVDHIKAAVGGPR